jgi:hypothetical protein
MPHVNIKIFAQPNQPVNAADAIPVFHRWIQRRDLPELLIDVADYTHVPEGPGVLLIAHEANYSLDYARNQLGLLYNRKAAASGSVEDELRQAYDAALTACRRLEQEPGFQGVLRFDPTHLEIVFNDRLLHPNTTESWREIQPAAERFLDGLFGQGKYSLERQGEPRERLRASVGQALPPAGSQ